MSETIDRAKEDCRSWTDKQKEEFIVKFREHKVVIDELSSLKKALRVYRQQPNSNIYFFADKSKTLSECKSECKNIG
ncbi:ASNSD1 upstream open reading frame protein-like isoform X2 [Mixophyes fleayi]|uniref:ASNSD1 upstream open reading frame protein-like isoform X2 n=1 Tax=Mixophyes fleayi TaxID=3061075 RepID=UPI003F4E184D